MKRVNQNPEIKRPNEQLVNSQGTGTAWEMETMTTETISEVDAELGKSEKYKISEQEYGNSEHAIMITRDKW